MANEMTYTGSGDLKVAAILNQLVFEKLVDSTDLRKVCRYFGDIAGRGSAALKIPQIQWDDAMAAANTDETTAVANTALGNGSVSITVARQALVYQLSDMFQITGGAAGSALEDFASKMSNAAVLRFTDMICTLFTSLATSKGTTGTDLTVDDIYDAQFALIQSRVAGPYVCVLAPIQMTDFMNSLRGELGAQVYNPQVLSALSGGAMQAKEWNGITFIDSDSVPTSGGDRVGAMFDLNCFGYAEAVPSAISKGAAPGSYLSVMPEGSPIYVAFERSEAAGLTSVVGNYFVGVSEIEDLRGVKLVSSAT